MTDLEIDEGLVYIGYREALALILTNTAPSKTEYRSLISCTGYVNAEDVVAFVNSPTDNVSLKDGFAVKAVDVANASPQQPIILKIIGSVFAGGRFKYLLENGQAVKICSGSPVPIGADAIVSAEFCEEKGVSLYIKASAETGRNIFFAGEDVKIGSIVAKNGKVLLPSHLGLIAAAGINQLKIYPKPKVSLIAIGDEVIAPGQKLKEGQLYASNLVNIGAWLSCFDIPYTTAVTVDDTEFIKNELLKSFHESDVIVTSGGAWGSERDLVISVLDSMGWKRLFHHVRMGPGKGMASGVWKDKVVFCLPGGPPSNEMAFMQLALPGILHMAGLTGSPLYSISAELTENVKSRHQAWTEFKKAKLILTEDGNYLAVPYFETSRLKSMANSSCLICKPEGMGMLHSGQTLTVQVMIPTFAGISITDMT
jgi:molybdopterin molybdotransferase